MMAQAAKARELLRRARHDIDQQHLLETAERVFAERGYEGTRMADVAEEHGVALATLYKLARSKEELYAAVHKERGGAMLEAAMQATQGAGSAWQALLRGVAAYVEFLVEHRDYLVLHLQESQPWALQPRFISAPQTKLWQSGLQLTVDVFRAAIAEGAAVDENPLLLARLMIAAHQVYLGEWVETGMREKPSELIVRMQAHLERAFGRAKKRTK
jgi:AcrR family transcriptional regulator